MKELGTCKNRKIVWIDYQDLLKGEMPNGDWVCLATSSDEKPDMDTFDHFTRLAITNKILVFQGHGLLGEFLHDLFDETIVGLEVLEGWVIPFISTTWHNDESLASAFWFSIYNAAAAMEAETNNPITVVVTSLDQKDFSDEFTGYLSQFNAGWIPED